MLIAARSSHDFACCARATESARSKYASASPRPARREESDVSRRRRIRRRTSFPWMPRSPPALRRCSAAHRIGRASHGHLPRTNVQRRPTLAPVDRQALTPEAIVPIASRFFQRAQRATLLKSCFRFAERAPFRRQNDKFLRERVCRNVVPAEDMCIFGMASPIIRVAAWPISRASLTARSMSARAASGKPSNQRVQARKDKATTRASGPNRVASGPCSQDRKARAPDRSARGFSDTSRRPQRHPHEVMRDDARRGRPCFSASARNSAASSCIQVAIERHVSGRQRPGAPKTAAVDRREALPALQLVSSDRGAAKRHSRLGRRMALHVDQSVPEPDLSLDPVAHQGTVTGKTSNWRARA